MQASVFGILMQSIKGFWDDMNEMKHNTEHYSTATQLKGETGGRGTGGSAGKLELKGGWDASQYGCEKNDRYRKGSWLPSSQSPIDCVCEGWSASVSDARHYESVLRVQLEHREGREKTQNMCVLCVVLWFGSEDGLTSMQCCCSQPFLANSCNKPLVRMQSRHCMQGLAESLPTLALIFNRYKPSVICRADTLSYSPVYSYNRWTRAEQKKEIFSSLRIVLLIPFWSNESLLVYMNEHSEALQVNYSFRFI
ncbi:unnamed protein product [Oppiella nova]|uniref:Uncharacterized protein n=1 Tax=Oppiella nova TaxID=334625 RepID=A0A7R9Q9Z2_9ACAR|nr:unnamed protein product [Oppiella nova]CAG2161387.1 unnamed protein product [Oppiella nova]